MQIKIRLKLQTYLRMKIYMSLVFDGDLKRMPANKILGYNLKQNKIFIVGERCKLGSREIHIVLITLDKQ